MPCPWAYREQVSVEFAWVTPSKQVVSKLKIEIPPAIRHARAWGRPLDQPKAIFAPFGCFAGGTPV